MVEVRSSVNTLPYETRPDSSLRYRRYINHLLTYLNVTGLDLAKLKGQRSKPQG